VHGQTLLIMVSLRQSVDLLLPTMSFHLRRCYDGQVGGQGRENAPAERAVAAYVLQGLSNKEIARALGKSECTVKNQVSAILAKTGVPTRARLMALLR